MAYAKKLTKEYLKSAGVTSVSPDGKEVRCGNKILNQYPHEDGYLRVTINNIVYGVHRVVYAWWNYEVPEGMVVDHYNNDKSDNSVFNLQLLTPSENIYKNRECNKYELKCRLSRPRSFYEDKLNKYLAEYEQAKVDKGSELCHKLRSNISQCRARLRYYDNHIDEANQIAAEQQLMHEAKLKKHTKVIARKQAAEIKEYLKSINDFRWHKFARLSRTKDLTESEIKYINTAYEPYEKYKAGMYNSK